MSSTTASSCDTLIFNVYLSDSNDAFPLGLSGTAPHDDSECRGMMYHGSPIIVAVTRTRVLSLILCSGQQLHWGPTLPRIASYEILFIPSLITLGSTARV